MRIIEARGPMLDLVETINKAVAKIYLYSGRRGITRVSFDSEWGLNNGLTPGTSAILWTSVGPVELYCERRLDLEYKEREQPQFELPAPIAKTQLEYIERAKKLNL